LTRPTSIPATQSTYSTGFLEQARSGKTIELDEL
jgi:hypothetical protein